MHWLHALDMLKRKKTDDDEIEFITKSNSLPWPG